MTKYLLACLMLLAACGGANPPPASPAADAAALPPGAVEVRPKELDAQRIEGDKMITPDADTRAAMRADHTSRLQVQARFCIDVGGSVTSVEILRSSGYPRFDQRTAQHVRLWKFRPWTRDGVAVPACATFTMFYEQR